MGDVIIIGDQVSIMMGSPVDYLKVLRLALAWKNWENYEKLQYSGLSDGDSDRIHPDYEFGVFSHSTAPFDPVWGVSAASEFVCKLYASRSVI
jgi:hypothetical protein